MKIFGVGNLEAIVQAEVSGSNLLFVEKILNSAVFLDVDTLLRMKNSVSGISGNILKDEWSPDLFTKRDFLWVYDTFWINPKSMTPNQFLIHDLNLIGVESLTKNVSNLKKQLTRTRMISWLNEQLLKEKSREKYFGSLTAALHETIQDDPIPYRTDIKTIVGNLLGYCEVFLNSEYEISRPNYSTKIRLL